MKKKFEVALAWGFECRGKLCNWAREEKRFVIEESLDLSRYYDIVPVYIVRRKDFRKKRKTK